MLDKMKYRWDLEIAPVRITWRQELVNDEDMGYFYLKLVPHVEWAEDFIEKREYWNGHITGKTYEYKPGTVGKVPASILGANARNKSAVQGRKIFNELKTDIAKKTQMRLRAESNKRRGQRWNKKG